jgi:hypothetical protein
MKTVPDLRKGFHLKIIDMKKLILLISLFLSFQGIGQGVMQSEGSNKVVPRFIVETGFRIPRGCNLALQTPNILDYSTYKSKGALMYDTCQGQLKVWSGVAWNNASGSGVFLQLTDTAAMLSAYQRAIPFPYTTKKYLTGYGTFGSMNSDSLSEGSTNLFFTDARARTAFSLTTTGTSGAATYNSSTGIFNIPLYGSSDSFSIKRYGAASGNARTWNAGGLGATQYYVNSIGPDSANYIFGYQSGNTLTTGYRNVFFGEYTGSTATTANNNIALGYQAYGGLSAKTGSNNFSAGNAALSVATSASDVIAIGFSAASNVTTSAASGTIALGNRAARNITTGADNIVLGSFNSNDQMGATSSGNTHIGNSVAFNTGSSVLINTTYYGSSSGRGATGSYNVGMGVSSLRNSTGSGNVGLGYFAGNNGGNSTLSGSSNIILGTGAKPMSYTANNQFTIWHGASTSAGTGGYNTLSRDSSGRWLFNITTSEVTSVASGAALEINGTTGGFLGPRLTTTQQNAISSPGTGLQIINTTKAQPHYYDGTTWQAQVGMTFGTAAPGTTPAAVGNFFLDTTNKKLYVSIGTASSADWEILN